MYTVKKLSAVNLLIRQIVNPMVSGGGSACTMGWLPSLRPPSSLIITTIIILIYLATRLLLFLFSSLLPSPAPTPLLRHPRPSSIRPRPESAELAPRLVALAQETNTLLRVLISLRTGNKEDGFASETDQDASEDEASEDEGPPNLVNITSERMRRYNTTMFQWAWVNHPELYQSPGLDSKEQSGLQRRRLSCLPRLRIPPLKPTLAQILFGVSVLHFSTRTSCAFAYIFFIWSTLRKRKNMKCSKFI